MLPARRTGPSGISAEVQPLAFAAPAPVRLTRRAGRVVRQRIIAASGFDVFPACRTRPGRIPAEVQPLAFAAPAPVRLTHRGRRIVRQRIIPASGFDVVPTCRTGLRRIPAEVQPLAFTAPAPVRLSVYSAINGLDTRDIIALQVAMRATIKGEHQRAVHIGVRQAQRMPDLMTGHCHQIDAGRWKIDRPGFGLVKMEVTGQRPTVRAGGRRRAPIRRSDHQKHFHRRDCRRQSG